MNNSNINSSSNLNQDNNIKPIASTSTLLNPLLPKQYDTERIFPVKSVVSAKRPPLPPRTSSSSTATIKSSSPIHSPTHHSRNNSSTFLNQQNSTTPSHSSLLASGRTLVQIPTPTFPTPDIIARLPPPLHLPHSNLNNSSSSNNVNSDGTIIEDFLLGKRGMGLNNGNNSSGNNSPTSIMENGIRVSLNVVDEEKSSSSKESSTTSKGSESRRKFVSKLVKDEFGSYWKIIGREGENQDEELGIEREEEVVAPGCVQSFAVLLVIEADSEGSIKVLQVSENSNTILSLSPSLLFTSSSFTNFLTLESIENLTEALETIFEPPSDTEDLFSTNPNKTANYSARTHSGRFSPPTQSNRHRTFKLEGFSTPRSNLQSSLKKKSDWKVFATLHRPNSDSQICLLELELQDDKLTPLSAEETEEVDLLPIASEKTEGSTETNSKSGRSLLRKRRKGREEGLDILSLLSRMEERLTGAKELQTFYQVTIDTIAEITRFERIIMEEFDADGNALVVAEYAPTLSTKFVGLTFPASDFPFPAYDKLGVIYDAAGTNSAMCCRSLKEVERVVDMRLCSIRGVESSKIRYLNNLSIKSTTTLALDCFNKPWGLISLQSSSTVRRTSVSSRQILALLIESINGHLEKFSYTRRLKARKFINGGAGGRIGGSNFRKFNGNHKDSSKESRAGLADTGSRGEEVIASGQVMKVESNRAAKAGGALAALTSMDQVANGYIVTKPDDLLLLFDSDFACLSVGEEVQIFGQVENTQDLFGAVEYFRYCGAEVLESSQNIAVDFPDLSFPGIAGVLFLPLGEDRLDFLLFFRLAEKAVIKWAGNPSQGINRTEFEPFEVVLDHGKCRSWKEEEIETSLVLCTVYGKFLDVWREKQSALVANQVTALLLSNTSHEVRTPLNHIINSLELALEHTTIDDKTRRAIKKSREASLSVKNVVDDLVDLARVPALRLEDSFALASTITDALAGPRALALRKGLDFEVEENPQGTPLILLGDRVKLRKIIATVAANAVKHTDIGAIRIEFGEVNDEDVLDGETGKKDGIRIGITITDTGKGIEDEILTSVFESFEKSSYAHLLNDNTRLLVGDGLDLSVVARIVSSLGGQLQIKSKMGLGTKVTLLLSFRLPNAGIETDTTQLSDAFQSSFGGISIGGTETIGDTSTIVEMAQGMSRSSSSKSALAEILGTLSNTVVENVPVKEGSLTKRGTGGTNGIVSANPVT